MYLFIFVIILLLVLVDNFTKITGDNDTRISSCLNSNHRDSVPLWNTTTTSK